MDRLNEAIRVMKEHQAKTSHLPIKLKVNEEWLNKQLENYTIIKTEGSENITPTICGIPVEFNDEIRDIQLIYRDEHLLLIQEEINRKAMEVIKERHFNCYWVTEDEGDE